MGYKLRLVLYYLNILAIGLSIAGLVFATTMIFIFRDEWLGWLKWMLVCLACSILLAALFIFRKNKFPVQGKDYF